MDSHILGNTVCRPADDAGDMGAVSVTIVPVLPISNKICGEYDPSPELSMCTADPGIYDISMNTCTGGIVGIGSVHIRPALIDPVESPRSIELSVLGLDHKIFFYVLYAC